MVNDRFFSQSYLFIRTFEKVTYVFRWVQADMSEDVQHARSDLCCLQRFIALVRASAWSSFAVSGSAYLKLICCLLCL
jgi:hypothetical protein